MHFGKIVFVPLAVLAAWLGLTGSPDAPRLPIVPAALLDAPGGIWRAPPELEVSLLAADYEARLAEGDRIELERVEAEAAERYAHSTPTVRPWNTPSPEWWAALAQCETGTRWDWHGPIYSSAYGIINDGIRQFAPSSDSVTRILAGVASADEQTVTAQALYDQHGPSAWGCTSRIGWP